jgi:DNA-directed RNA polymerase subunit F
MADTTARLDSEQLRDAVNQLKQMTENCAEAIQITLAAVVTGSPDESVRPVFLKDTMSVFKAQENLMRGQQDNMDTLSRMAEQYIEEHAGVASGF